MRSGSLQVLLDERVALVARLRERVLREWDPEAVHDLRVATRRLQEALSFCEPWLDRRAASRLRRRARSLRRSLGDLRNADVLADLLAAFINELPRNLREPARTQRRLIGARAAALRTAGRLGALHLPAMHGRAEALQSSLHAPALSAATEHCRGVAAQRGRSLADALPTALTGQSVALHRLRIAFKRWRYALEILQSIQLSCGFPIAPALKSAREMQTTLGLLHDLDVLIDLLGSLPGPGRAGLLSFLRVRRRESLPRLLDQIQAFQIPGAGRLDTTRGRSAS